MKKISITKSILVAVSLMLLVTCRVQAQGKWLPLSPKGLIPCFQPHAVVVGEKIYVLGGLSTDASKTILQVYTPASDTWATLSTTGVFTPRTDYTLSSINGKIYMFGGVEVGGRGNVNLLESFDSSSNTWETPITTGPVPAARSNAASVVVGGLIYIFGGSGDSGYLHDICTFDPSISKWDSLVTNSRYDGGYGMTACAVGDTIFAIDGYYEGSSPAVQPFSVSSKTWGIGEFGTHKKLLYSNSFVIENKIYLISTQYVYPSIERFDPSTYSWESLSVTGPFPLQYFASAAIGHKIYMMCGETDTGFVSANEVYDLDAVSGVQTSPKVTSQAWPNPTTGMVTLNAQSAVRNVVIVNALGVEIPASGLFTLTNSSVHVDLHSQPNGSYFIRVFERSGTEETFRVAKLR